MVSIIGFPKSVAAEADPISMLTACHGRIRRFGDGALKLSRVTGAPAWQVAETATSVRRYFAEALPLHEMDEEEDLKPLVMERSPSLHVRSSLRTMQKEHRSLDHVIEELIPMWTRLEAEPERLWCGRPRLRRLTEELVERLCSVVELEETVLLPAARRVLDSEDMDFLRRSFLDRRRSAVAA
ncbi:MAG: hemerythrin domain-containing protein [Myxococcota bacterium]